MTFCGKNELTSPRKEVRCGHDIKYHEHGAIYVRVAGSLYITYVQYVTYGKRGSWSLP